MSQKNNQNDFKEIIVSNNGSDLWENLNREPPSKSILSFRDGTSHKLRFIGPFCGGQRLFTFPDIHLHVSPTEKKQILQGNADVKESVVSRICKMKEKSKRKKILDTLKKMYLKENWQRIVYSNAIILDTNSTFHATNPSIMCLNSSICHGILEQSTASSSNEEEVPRDQWGNKKLSGLYAHNITIVRKGQGLNSKYEVKVSEHPEMLPNAMISLILRKGLYDIKAVLQSYNKTFINPDMSDSPSAKNPSIFIYKTDQNYKMSAELMKDIYCQADEVNDILYNKKVEENINDVPEEAFENDINKNTIGSLEI